MYILKSIRKFKVVIIIGFFLFFVKILLSIILGGTPLTVDFIVHGCFFKHNGGIPTIGIDNECLKKIVIKKNNLKNCRHVKDEASCLAVIGQNTNNEAACKDATNIKIKKECLSSLSMLIKNNALCEQSGDSFCLEFLKE